MEFLYGLLISIVKSSVTSLCVIHILNVVVFQYRNFIEILVWLIKLKHFYLRMF